MKNFIFAFMFIFVAATATVPAKAGPVAPGPTVTAAAHTVRVANRSSYIIRNLYVSDSRSRRWGNDLLGSGVLRPGYHVDVAIHYSGYYDFAVVDEDGDRCVITEVHVAESKIWTISNALLFRCAGYSE